MFISRIYLFIICLLGSGLLEEGNEGEDIDISFRAFTVDLVKVADVKDFVKNQFVFLYISFLGLVIINMYIWDKLSKDGNLIVWVNSTRVMELGFDPDIIMWETVFNAFLEIKCRRI